MLGLIGPQVGHLHYNPYLEMAFNSTANFSSCNFDQLATKCCHFAKVMDSHAVDVVKWWMVSVTTMFKRTTQLLNAVRIFSTAILVS